MRNRSVGRNVRVPNQVRDAALSSSIARAVHKRCLCLRQFSQRRQREGTSTGTFPSPVAFQRKRWSEVRSEEHMSELQSLMRISYAVFCLKKKKQKYKKNKSHKTNTNTH